MWCPDEKRECLSNFRSRHGYFGRIGQDKLERDGRVRVISWFSCREDFHWDTNLMMSGKSRVNTIPDRKRFVFDGGEMGTIQSIVAFIGEFESRLGIVKGSRFGPTLKPNVIWVEPAVFWRKHAMRRSLYTALLRCGDGYKLNNSDFNKTLKSKEYTHSTLAAVHYFLMGNTTYRGRIMGWQAAFEGKSTEEIQNLLVNTRDRKHVG